MNTKAYMSEALEPSFIPLFTHQLFLDRQDAGAVVRPEGLAAQLFETLRAFERPIRKSKNRLHRVLPAARSL